MNFQPKAKPIHFRIVSGGVECASLDDLCQHFSIKSVTSTINDGRLVKWLNHIKEEELAKKIETFKGSEFNTDEECLKLISTITGKNYDRKGYQSELDYIKALDNDACTREIAINTIKGYLKTDLDILLYAYHNHTDLIPNVRSYFGTFINTDNPEVHWVYGMTCYKKNSDITHIKKAANKGFQEAVDFICKYEDRFLTNKRKSEITEVIRAQLSIWATCPYICKEKFDKLSYKNYSNYEIDIFRLCSFCCELAKASSMYEVISLLKKRTTTFGKVQKEFLFLRLYARENESSRMDLKKEYLKLDYNPAHQIATTDCKEIQTKQSHKIKMIEKPNIQYFRTFMYEFMCNILYF